MALKKYSLMLFYVCIHKYTLQNTLSTPCSTQATEASVLLITQAKLEHELILFQMGLGVGLLDQSVLGA